VSFEDMIAGLDEALLRTGRLVEKNVRACVGI
jgi:hypothetical protein